MAPVAQTSVNKGISSCKDTKTLFPGTPNILRSGCEVTARILDADNIVYIGKPFYRNRCNVYPRFGKVIAQEDRQTSCLGDSLVMLKQLFLSRADEHNAIFDRN